MIKVIAFDLDGTLVSTKDLHFNCLNEAIAEFSPDHVISYEDHLANFDGLPTHTKLMKLMRERKLKQKYIAEILLRKQKNTEMALESFDFKIDHSELFSWLKTQPYKLTLCTNSIYKSTDTILRRLNLHDKFDLIVTNETVDHPKPAPEMYRYVIDHFDVYPNEIIVLEDSDKGIEAAKRAGCNVVQVDDPHDVQVDALIRSLYIFNHMKL